MMKEFLKQNDIKFEIIKEMGMKIIDTGILKFLFDSHGKLVELDGER